MFDRIEPDGVRWADGSFEPADAILWATGFRQSYDWVDLPLDVTDGWPTEYRGVVETVPGLFFCGLAFQYAFSSGEMNGVGRDAAYLARKIDARTRTRVPTTVSKTVHIADRAG